jgi:PAS domain S-box-containing protein
MLTLLDYRVRQREFLLEISRAITAKLDLGEVLRRVLQASMTMLHGQVGVIMLRELNSDRYRVRAALGLSAERVPALDERLNALIASTHDETDPKAIDAALSEIATSIDPRMKQAFALPLVIDDEPRGLLVVFRIFVGPATPDDLQVLQSFADQAAIAVNNAQLYAQIDHERMRLAAILQNSGDGVMILDASLTVLGINRALEKMLGWSLRDVIGQHSSVVMVWERLEGGDLQSAIDAGWPYRRAADAPEEIVYVEGDLRRADGIRMSIGIRYAPLIDASGALVSIIANVRDITHFRQAQEMQNMFISTVSHELKTPVALIKGYAATMRRDDITWTAEQVRDNSAIIEDEADRLTALIENLLAASRLQAERGLRLGQLHDVQLDGLAQRAVERFRAQHGPHRFRVQFPKHFPVVQGDEVRLRQVLDNLLSNAVKYSPEGGTITVSGRADADAVYVSVRDQGIGMTAAEREHLFERFYRADSALSRKTQGTGLGLYLSKAFIEAHGGHFTVESAPGRGSTFTFVLPIR